METGDDYVELPGVTEVNLEFFLGVFQQLPSLGVELVDALLVRSGPY